MNFWMRHALDVQAWKIINAGKLRIIYQCLLGWIWKLLSDTHNSWWYLPKMHYTVQSKHQSFDFRFQSTIIVSSLQVINRVNYNWETIRIVHWLLVLYVHTRRSYADCRLTSGRCITENTTGSMDDDGSDGGKYTTLSVCVFYCSNKKAVSAI